MKIDVTKIEGYDTMTAEEQRDALLGFDIEIPKDDSEKLKNMLSKKNSEIADLTKQLRAKQTDEEAAAAERKRLEDEKDARIAELEKKERINELTSQYLTIGFTAEEAKEQAEAFISGDFSTVFRNHKNHVENVGKQAVAEAVTKNHLSTGDVPTPKDDNSKLRRAMGLPN